MTFPRVRSHVPLAAPRTSLSTRILPIYAHSIPRWRILPRINWTSHSAFSSAPTATLSIVLHAAWLTTPIVARDTRLSLPVPPLLLATSPPVPSPLLRTGIVSPSSPAGLHPPSHLAGPHAEIFNHLLTTSCDLQNIPAARLATTCAILLPGLIEEGHRSHHLHVGHLLQDLGIAVDSVDSDTASGPHARSIDSLSGDASSGASRSAGSAAPCMVLVDQLQPLLADPHSTALPPSFTPHTTGRCALLHGALHRCRQHP